jgi:hypothetical protein
VAIYVIEDVGRRMNFSHTATALRCKWLGCAKEVGATD